jgi:pyruvate kinase
MIKIGFDVARLNFSHGTYGEQFVRLRRFRRICSEENAAIPVMLDTKGPEIRLGIFENDFVNLESGQEYTLTTDECMCNNKIAHVSYKGLSEDATIGATILIDDGHVALEVISIDGNNINCIVKNSGKISNKKSVNLPDCYVRLPALSEQDKEDLKFGIKHNINYVAASFIRKPEDVIEIRTFLSENGGENIHIIAKIENREGLNNLDGIIRNADGIMVARGDLGVEIPLEEIPVAQKQMITLCRSYGKPIITATQMLDSMIHSPRPTRAEVTDVANAVYDGTSAVMLSGETASGEYPTEALTYMHKIAGEAELHTDKYRVKVENLKIDNVSEAIAHGAITLAGDLGAAAIVIVTAEGLSASQLSSLEPDCPVLALTYNINTFYRLRLYRGVYPFMSELEDDADSLFADALRCAKTSGTCNKGDLVVLTAGMPLGVAGTTNMLRVETV